MRRAALALFSVSLFACAASDRPAPSPALGLQSATSQAVASGTTVIAEGFTGPGERPFQVARRTSAISQYPCAACHDRAVEQPSATEPASMQWSHLDVSIVHADALRCATCHRYEGLDQLRLIDAGTPINFDHSYLVCAQCHSSQARDWAGGAHGKRLGGWQGERVVETCTGCHDPHQPAFETRMPLLSPRVPRTGGGDRLTWSADR